MHSGNYTNKFRFKKNHQVEVFAYQKNSNTPNFNTYRVAMIKKRNKRLTVLEGGTLSPTGVLALELLFESDPPFVLFLPAPLGGRGRTVSFPRFLLPLECEATWELNSFFCFSIFSGVCLSMRESLTHSSQFLFQPEKTSLIQVLD